jgi:hypothetical protein
MATSYFNSVIEGYSYNKEDHLKEYTPHLQFLL